MLMLYRIYDEKIAKIDRELEQLTSPEPTHPELLRQLECLQCHRDKKIHYEHTLISVSHAVSHESESCRSGSNS